jgi:TonB-linked SusC/RagA family outer membrane protein
MDELADPRLEPLGKAPYGTVNEGEKMNATRRMGAVLLALAAVVGWTATAAAQATGTIQGMVMDAQARRPLSGVQVSIPNTRHGTLTNSQGRYQLVNVPAGTHTVRAQFIGFSPGTQAVTVAEGATVTANFALETTAVALQEVVVTGVSGATTRAKVPFAIEQLRAADMPVPMVSAGQAIQGKVPGAQVVQGSGLPGSAPSILLRGATSIDGSGRGQEPLYIVDGVILSSSMVDIDALSIETVEVIKGAAAASLYGSRAANGVVQITTRRGTGGVDDQVRYSARTEYGRNQLRATPGSLLTGRHHYITVPTDSGTFFASSGGPCRFEFCSDVQLAGQGRSIDPETNLPIGLANAWNTFQNNTWPRAYDQVAEFFSPGEFHQTSLSAEGRAGATNFHVSFSNVLQGSVIPGVDGYERNNFRLNLDQSLRQNVTLSGSAFYSRGSAAEFPEANGGPIFRLTRQPAGANLRGCIDDPDGDCTGDPSRMILTTHPEFRADSENPLYEMLVREQTVQRGRFLGSANLRVSPTRFWDVDLNASYDRLDYEEEDYIPLGFRTFNPSGWNDGRLSRWIQLNEGLNGSLTSTVRYRLHDRVQNRTQLRYLFEVQDQYINWTRGEGFQVEGIPQFQNLDQSRVIASSSRQNIASDGYFLITNLDIADRYIVDALVRNDGSSLFGEDERRQWYYRVAGAWRAAEEGWFPIRGFDEFKLRAALGTAGSRPRFEAQYETFSVTGGRVAPLSLGNVNLRPEFSREIEVGLDAAMLNGRVVASLTHANVRTEDQILRVPLPGFTGYREQWQNAGTLESRVWEASLDARLLERRDLTWNARLLFDRTRSVITELSVAPFPYGVFGQNLGTVFYARPGERMGTFYGMQFATSCDHLPAGLSCDGFAVNDDGYLVWAGEGGLGSPQWGESAPAHVAAAASHLATARWGTPIGGMCTDRESGEQTLYCPLGSTMPDFSVGFSSTVNWRGFTLYGLLDAQQGFHVYNQPLQWATFRRTSGLFEQDPDVPLEQQKPLGYYDEIYNASGLRPSSAFVEDASFVKLREMSLSYRFGGDALEAIPGLRTFSGIGVHLVGRNLHTWTGYRGFDPEVGSGVAPAGGGSSPGSAAIARVDGYQYPNFRNWTLGIEVNF